MRSIIQLYHDKKVLAESRNYLQKSKAMLNDIINKAPGLYNYLYPRLQALEKEQAELETAYIIESQQRVKGTSNLGYLPLLWAIAIGGSLLLTYGTSKVVQHVTDTKTETERLECINSLINAGMGSDQAIAICGKPDEKISFLDEIKSYAKVFTGISITFVIVFLLLRWKKL